VIYFTKVCVLFVIITFTFQKHKLILWNKGIVTYLYRESREVV